MAELEEHADEAAAEHGKPRRARRKGSHWSNLTRLAAGRHPPNGVGRRQTRKGGPLRLRIRSSTDLLTVGIRCLLIA